MRPALRDDELRLLATGGGDLDELTCVVRGVTIDALTVLDDERTYILRASGLTGWWVDADDGQGHDIDVVEDVESAGTMSTMPDRLWAHYSGTLQRWADGRTVLTLLATDRIMFLHDGTTALPLPCRPYPDAPVEGA